MKKNSKNLLQKLALAGITATASSMLLVPSAHSQVEIFAYCP